MTLNRTELVFVVALLLFAAGLRLIGVESGNPPDLSAFPTTTALDMVPYSVPVQPDEFQFVAAPYQMVITRQLNPHFFDDPSFLVNLNFFTFLLTGEGRGRTIAQWKGIDEREHAPFRFYVIGRVYSALGGLLAVAAIYALARRIAGRRAALFAGLLVAAAEPLVQHAHYTTSNSLSVGFVALALWAALMCLYRPRWWLFWIAGIAAGFAAGNRYNAAAVSIVVFVVGLILLYRRDLHWRRVLIGWLLFPDAFALSTPHVIFDPESVVKAFQFVFFQYTQGVGIDLTTPYGLFYEYRYLIIFGIGVPAALAVLIGLYAAWRKRPRHLLRENSVLLVVLVTATFVIPYSLVVLTTKRPGFSDQLLFPVIPVYMLIAGIGGAWVAQKRWLISVGVALILVSVPLTLSVQVVRQFARVDTRYVMQEWIYDHLPHGSKVQLVGPYNVPLDVTYYTVTQNFGGDFTSLVDLKAAGIDYVVLSDSYYHDEERSREVATPEREQLIEDYIASFEALPLVARLDRAILLGDDWMTYTMTPWSDPGLMVYCLTPQSCAAVH